jgi:colanic acid/amylovoran biosynthesis glycosyltransferase
MRIAYLCNSFPETSEPYVADEIRELRRHSADVLPCSVRRSGSVPATERGLASQTLHVFPLQIGTCLHATWLCIWRFSDIQELVWRVLCGPEPVGRRIRTLAHTWLGAYLAARLRRFSPGQIHAHHGYFASWVGMVAARFLRAGFSMTLHGSDLLVRADYLDVKLKESQFCFTISEFNRRYILDRYPDIDAEKIVVQRLGVDPNFWRPLEVATDKDEFSILTVGRLHPVKNHGFLLLACRALKSAGVSVRCVIAGEGEERPRLEQLIQEMDLETEVRLLGQMSREKLPDLYAKADAVVLTSHSEGIPVALMEAMAMERIVLAPEITGIPELVLFGKTGFLYQPSSMEDFLTQLQLVLHAGRLMSKMRCAARQHVERHFNAHTNLAQFARTFLDRARIGVAHGAVTVAGGTHEDPVLQQI